MLDDFTTDNTSGKRLTATFDHDDTLAESLPKVIKTRMTKPKNLRGVGIKEIHYAATKSKETRSS